eukprot:1148080-Pelagomonas_calceolata.AAC.9
MKGPSSAERLQQRAAAQMALQPLASKICPSRSLGRARKLEPPACCCLETGSRAAWGFFLPGPAASWDGEGGQRGSVWEERVGNGSCVGSVHTLTGFDFHAAKRNCAAGVLLFLQAKPVVVVVFCMQSEDRC